MKQVLIALVISASAGLFGQQVNEDYPVGRVYRHILFNKKWHATFEPEFNSFVPNRAAADVVKKHRKQLTFKIVMGFWCEDSHVWVPRFLKILEEYGISEDQFKIFGVDEDKKAGFEGFMALNIVNVPTFIVYYDKKEMGRIVEQPDGDLENHLLRILKPLSEKR
jgi:hypothetical protein